MYPPVHDAERIVGVDAGRTFEDRAAFRGFHQTEFQSVADGRLAPIGDPCP